VQVIEDVRESQPPMRLGPVELRKRDQEIDERAVLSRRRSARWREDSRAAVTCVSFMETLSHGKFRPRQTHENVQGRPFKRGISNPAGNVGRRS